MVFNWAALNGSGQFDSPDLETILDKGNSSAHQNHDPQGRVLIFEVPIPGDGHEDVGDGQQQDRLHKTSLSLVRSVIA